MSDGNETCWKRPDRPTCIKALKARRAYEPDGDHQVWTFLAYQVMDEAFCKAMKAAGH